MGKKVKTGKARRDKFYHLAKETGLRARSAFKLIQLNRKYGFLEKSRVCIDLCAAPGGWLQVASQAMPASSLIVGVDLVAIKPIKNVTTFQADITTERCRQLLRKELKTWKADVVLHDGAPNVGKAWVQDAYTQSALVLKSLKLATEFLTNDGVFVTKVFRSRDYNALMWVFKQLFKKVSATKPSSSRNVSAEIFVVCQGYLNPHKIDQRMLDPTHVFEEVQEQAKPVDVFSDIKEKKKKPEGYEEGKTLLYKACTAEEFCSRNDFIEVLANYHSILIDPKSVIAKHVQTTPEVKSLCEDLRVLGKKDFKILAKWRQHIRKFIEDQAEKHLHPNGKEGSLDEQESSGEEWSGDDDEVNDDLHRAIDEASEAERARLKREKRRKQKARQKLREKIALQMETPRDMAESLIDDSLFDINNLKRGAKTGDLDEYDIADVSLPAVQEQMNTDSDSDVDEGAHETDDEDDEFVRMEKELDAQYIEFKERKTGTKFNVASLQGTKPTQSTNATSLWFQRDEFDTNPLEQTMTTSQEVDSSESEDDADMDDESDEENEIDSSDIVETESKSIGQDKQVNLDAEGLALAAEMIVRKRKADVVDAAYNRYTFDDEIIPAWFEDEERKHRIPTMPISKEMVKEIRERERAVNARPIKKVLESKMRKKRKEDRQKQKVNEQVETITSSEGLSDREKANQIKQLYNKLHKKKKEETTYVVAKRATASKRPVRPRGLKGRYLMVDKRMKADKRGQQSAERRLKRRKRK